MWLEDRKIRELTDGATATPLPIKPDIGVLGRKWALRILADIGFRETGRFSSLFRANPGITRRVLSRRLRELEASGLLRRGKEGSGGTQGWTLTEQGLDVLPLVMYLIAYGARWNPSYRYTGRLPKALANRT